MDTNQTIAEMRADPLRHQIGLARDFVVNAQAAADGHVSTLLQRASWLLRQADEARCDQIIDTTTPLPIVSQSSGWPAGAR